MNDRFPALTVIEKINKPIKKRWVNHKKNQHIRNNWSAGRCYSLGSLMRVLEIGDYRDGYDNIRVNLKCTICERITDQYISKSKAQRMKVQSLIRLDKSDQDSEDISAFKVFEGLFLSAFVVGIAIAIPASKAQADLEKRIVASDRKHSYSVNESIRCHMFAHDDDGARNSNDRIWVPCKVTAKSNQAGYYYVQYADPGNNKTTNEEADVLDMQPKN